MIKYLVYSCSHHCVSNAMEKNEHGFITCNEADIASLGKETVYDITPSVVTGNKTGVKDVVFVLCGGGNIGPIDNLAPDETLEAGSCSFIGTL